MARNLNPKCRQCRREGIKLFLKGERCYSPKCTMIKKKYPPGLHGIKRQIKSSGYGLQLREKQRAKKIYRILEKQFENYFKKAQKLKGDTGQNLLKLLELRLDNVIYRTNLFSSRDKARQIVSHGHVLVNEQKVNIPSYQVKKGQKIKFKEDSLFKHLKEEQKEKKGKLEIPKWLSMDEKKLEFKIVEEPSDKDLLQNIDTKLIVEYYSR